MTYSEKLLDPRWQKKRLKILERDGFACKYCGDTKKTLHVHHDAYYKEPWDVPDDDLATCCKDCHFIIEFIKECFAYYKITKFRKERHAIDPEPIWFISVDPPRAYPGVHRMILLFTIKEGEVVFLTHLYAWQATILGDMAMEGTYVEETT